MDHKRTFLSTLIVLSLAYAPQAHAMQRGFLQPGEAMKDKCELPPDLVRLASTPEYTANLIASPITLFMALTNTSNKFKRQKSVALLEMVLENTNTSLCAIKDQKNQNILDYACSQKSQNYRHCVEIILDVARNRNELQDLLFSHPDGGWPALFHIAFFSTKNSVALAELIINAAGQKASDLVFVKLSNDRTALFMAVMMYDKKGAGLAIIKKLVQAAGDRAAELINLGPTDGISPLAWAIREDFTEVIAYLKSYLQ